MVRMVKRKEYNISSIYVMFALYLSYGFNIGQPHHPSFSFRDLSVPSHTDRSLFIRELRTGITKDIFPIIRYFLSVLTFRTFFY